MYLIFDTETTGLPQFTKYRGFHDPQHTQFYDTARILSVSWLLLDKDLERVSAATYYVCPDGFRISPESILVHGITEEVARAKGVPIRTVLAALREALAATTTTIVAHTLTFDLNVVASECHRYGEHALAACLKTKQRFCTMQEGKKMLRMGKNPKLGELYRALYGTETTNAHDAEYDTLYCCECFVALMVRMRGGTPPQPKPVPAPNTEAETEVDNTPLKLSDEQRAVVHGEVSGSGCAATLVVACAGSGKTTTIVQRIHHLLTECDAPPQSVMLTTFSHNAAMDMKARLSETMEGESGVIVGTFDSLALQLVSKHALHAIDPSRRDVSEYSAMFVEFLNTAEGAAYARGIKHLFVDEFQDINDVQFEIVRLFHTHGASITCVGDDAQSIYGFRDANVAFMRHFDTHFPNAKTHAMCTNYRSTADIVAVANASVLAAAAEKEAIQKTMVAVAPGEASHSMINPKPTVSYFDDRMAQYAYILNAIKSARKAAPHGEIAVLCPQNRFLHELEDVLLRNNVPARVLEHGGGSGGRTGRLETGASSSRPVCLATIHKAKGLEWDTVFVMMMNDDILPMCKTSPAAVAEGRRLFYVAVTRAKRALHLTFAPTYGTSPHDGSMGSACRVSRYVAELDRSLFVFRGCQPCHFSMDTPAHDAENKNKTTSPVWKTINVKRAIAAAMTPKTLQDMRDTRALPAATWHETSEVAKIYEDVPYLDFVTQHEIHAEFDAFVSLYVQRCLAIAYGAPIAHRPAAETLASVPLDYAEHVVYQKFADNFTSKSNLAKIGELIKGSNVFKKRSAVMRAFLASPPASMQSDEMSVVLRILRKMEKASRRTGVGLHEIRTRRRTSTQGGGSSWVGDDAVRERLHDAYETFADAGASLEDAVLATWHVSTSASILNGQRRRVLHTDVSKTDLMRYARLFELIERYFVPALKDRIALPSTAPSTSPTGAAFGMSVSMDQASFSFEAEVFGVVGHPHQDLHQTEEIRRVSIVTVHCSTSPDPSGPSGPQQHPSKQTGAILPLDATLQLLCAKHMYERTHANALVDRVYVFNPLKGEMACTDVSSYDMGSELLRALASSLKSTA